MLEERSSFISDVNSTFVGQKNKFHSLLNKLGWTIQSVTGPIKEADEVNNMQDSHRGKDPVDSIKKQSNDEGEQSLTRADDPTELGGTSKDSEKRYNELLASLSFQPRSKQEKLSDQQLLASLLEAERNAKRRRISYRNKIHTKNKSQTEILREVIREQMEFLKGDNQGENKNTNGSNENDDDDNDGMIEISLTDGNPHLVWQNVSVAIERKQNEKKKRSYLDTSHERHYNRHKTLPTSYKYNKDYNRHCPVRRHHRDSTERYSDKSPKSHRKKYRSHSKERRYRSKSPNSRHESKRKHKRRGDS